MVIIHTNSLAQKLLYLSFHFQNGVDCEASLLSFTWGRGFQFLDAVLWNWDYGSIYFWTHPLSSHPDLVVLIPSSASPILLVCSPDIELISSLTFFKFFNICFPSFSFPPSVSPSLLLSFSPWAQSVGTEKKKKYSCLFLRTQVGQEHLCPRNMLRLIQFARACRSCKYLWATEKKWTQAHRVKEPGREQPNTSDPRCRSPGARCN